MRGHVFAALLLVGLAAASPARAEDEIASAEKQLADGEKELAAAGGTCVSMCKALQSMMTAADRICALAQGGSAEDQSRCNAARTKVQEAIARVRAACPDCNPAPPLAPSSAPAAKQEAPAAPMATGGMAMEVRAERTPRSVSVTLDATRLFLPAYMVQLRFEKALTPRVSVALTGGYGSLPSYGNESRGRASATLIGAEMRGYLLGGFDTTGLFVSAEIVQRNASLFFDEHVSSRTFVQGLTVGPTIGVKMVTFGGFTVESRVGAAYVVDDKRRDDGLAHDKIVPTFGVGLGFTL